MEIVFYFIIGAALLFLGGKDPAETYVKQRNAGKTIKQSVIALLPLFIIPWPRSVNKRLIWIAAGCFLLGVSFVKTIKVWLA